MVENTPKYQDVNEDSEDFKEILKKLEESIVDKERYTSQATKLLNIIVSCPGSEADSKIYIRNRMYLKELYRIIKETYPSRQNFTVEIKFTEKNGSTRTLQEN